MDYRTNQSYLKNEQYKDSQNLGARIAIHVKYSTNTYNLHHWAFDLMCASTQTTASVLECGTGRGDLWANNLKRIPTNWHMTLTDLSSGMLADARQKVEADGQTSQFDWQEADVQALPFDDDAFDLTVANFMLYHVPDVSLGVSELRRVLKANGTLHAFTLGQNHMHQLKTLVKHVFNVDMSFINTRQFSLENGEAYLRQYFDDVQLLHYESDLKVTQTDDLMAYINSTKMGNLMDDTLQAKARQLIDDEIADKGFFYIQKDTGVFIAR